MRAFQRQVPHIILDIRTLKINLNLKLELIEIFKLSGENLFIYLIKSVDYRYT